MSKFVEAWNNWDIMGLMRQLEQAPNDAVLKRS
jgi:hypothetical protein